MRSSLTTFLRRSVNRTGQPLETAAVAELSGYTTQDARDEGWPDIFAAAAQIPGAPDESPSPVDPGSAGAVGKALRRGLTYTAPIVAMWAIFPAGIATAELRYLAFLVVLSWGGSLASSHVVAAFLRDDPRGAWWFALGVAALATTAAVIGGWQLHGSGAIGTSTFAVGVVQVAYFFTASPLMLMPDPVGLRRIAVWGAIAGGITLGLGTLVAQQEFVPLQVLVGMFLLGPSVLLVRQAVRSGWPRSRPSANVSFRDVVSFGGYGAASGVLALWVLLAMPDTGAEVLLIVVVAALGLAEVAVARVHLRAAQTLGLAFDAGSFASHFRRSLLVGLTTYLIPVALTVTVVLFALSGWGAPDPALALAAIAVVGLGTVQILSLMGMTLHGIRVTAPVLLVAASALILVPLQLDDTLGRAEAYLTVLFLLAGALSVLVLRLGSRPVNFL